MKKLILLSGSSLFCLLSFAQVRVALTGGVHGASVTPKFLVYPDTISKNTSVGVAGIELGLAADIPIRYGFYFRPGVLFSAKGSNWMQTYDTTNLVANTQNRPEGQKDELLLHNTKLHVTYIDVPLNLVYKLNIKGKTKFMIGGGPQLSFLYNGYKSVSTTSVSQRPGSAVEYHFSEEKNTDLPIGKLSGHYRTVHLGVDALAGFEFGKVYITANYTRGLNAFFEEEGRKYKHQTIGAAIGIYLGSFGTAPSTLR